MEGNLYDILFVDIKMPAWGLRPPGKGEEIPSQQR
jgi:hypothetical protein